MGGGSAGSTSSQSSFPYLFNWESLLTPWQKMFQPEVVQDLYTSSKSGGMTPQQESSLWGTAKTNIQQGTDVAGRNFARQAAASGISPNSPSMAGGYSDIAAGGQKNLANAASQFIQTKLGQSNTVMNQLLTALFTPAPSAVGQFSTGSSRTMG